MQIKRTDTRRKGAAAVLAMLFLVIFSTLTLAMYSLSTTNMESASNLSDVERARASAESGLRWINYRLRVMARPKTTVGNIDATTANSLWTPLANAIQTDFNSLLNSSERTLSISGKTITSQTIAVDDSTARFKLTMQQHPLFTGDPLDERYVRITSTGTYRGATRSSSMDFKIEKKVKFAIVGKVPVQLGRNTVVEGPVAMATAAKYPPILMLSDFTHFDSNLKTKILNFETFLRTKHNGYDGRISVNNSTEYNQAKSAGYDDWNGDRYVDEYDLFLKQYDRNNDKAISTAEFTDPATNKLYDENLFKAMDATGGPLYDGDTVRTGYQDNQIDNSDVYAKVNGQLLMAATQSGFSSWATSQSKTIYDYLTGPVVTNDPLATPVRYSVTNNDVFDLDPSNFEQCALNFRARTGPENGTTSSTATLKVNKVLASTDANATAVTERTPLGSTSYQATYRRPVFRNMTFRNCRIPKGLNALFDNCVFEGVTFVEITRDITTSSGAVTTSSSAGMTWSQKMRSGSFSSSTTLTATNSYGFTEGNNIRFNDCTFRGPLAGNYATAYTHFTNSWEFTGATLFDNQDDETATIVSPQVNIEMGSFTNPANAPSTLKGVVVAGNLDIRGTSAVDGSIIITGDGAGNTTLGYFGASDGDTNPSAMPEGGYGRLSIRYNPNRALPDGINVSVDVTPQVDTYSEGIR
jgi:Tfp pilus assembly protein PilX